MRCLFIMLDYYIKFNIDYVLSEMDSNALETRHEVFHEIWGLES